MTRSYFRSFGHVGRDSSSQRPEALAQGALASNAPSEEVVRFLKELREAGVLEAPAPRSLTASERQEAQGEPQLKLALVALRDTDPGAYAKRLTELSYLANVLLSGCSVAGRAFRPLEAADVAVAVCNPGLERLLHQEAKAPAMAEVSVEQVASLLEHQELVRPFRVGWSILHHDVLLFTARSLQNALSRMAGRLRDPQPAKELARMAAKLKADIRAGKPWWSRSGLDGLGILARKHDYLHGSRLHCVAFPEGVLRGRRRPSRSR